MKSQYGAALALLIGVGLGAAAVQSLHAQEIRRPMQLRKSK